MKKYLFMLAISEILVISSIAVDKPFKYKMVGSKDIAVKENYPNRKPTKFLIDRIPKKKADQVFGLDLSHHQQNINWEEIGKNPPHFIIFKTTEGSSHVDTKYSNYHKKARKAGILVGGYHFFSYQSSGKEQAKHFLKYLRLEKGDIIPTLDVECGRVDYNLFNGTKKELLEFCY